MTTIIMQNQSPKMKDWETGCLCGCCNGGPVMCLYVSFCFCCATGDVATAAGKDYCCTCCLVPAFLPCIMPCYLNGDRAALAMRYNIADPLGGCGACCAFYAGCSTCLIVQELVEIEYQKRQGGQNQTVVITQQPQMVMQPQYAPQPGYPQQMPPQGQYPPQGYPQQQYPPQQYAQPMQQVGIKQV